MPDGRVLRSRSVPGLDQEVYALLATCQALIRTAADAMTTRPGLAMERISFTVLLQAATDQVTTATGIHAVEPNNLLLGSIGRTLLDNLLPTAGRQRLKARSRKNPTSRYGPNVENIRKSSRPTLSPPRFVSWKADLHPAPPVDATALTAIWQIGGGREILRSGDRWGWDPLSTAVGITLRSAPDAPLTWIVAAGRFRRSLWSRWC
jgi:hypothetical protein